MKNTAILFASLVLSGSAFAAEQPVDPQPDNKIIRLCVDKSGKKTYTNFECAKGSTQKKTFDQEPQIVIEKLPSSDSAEKK